MKLLPSLSFLARLALAGVVAGPVFFLPSAQAQAPAVATLDVQDSDNAQAALNAGKLEEAAALYEGIPVKYPTSILIPQATVKLGYVYFRLQQYDKAVKKLQDAAAIKNVPPAIVELALSLIPQVQSAKAGTTPLKDPLRKPLFEEAVKGFDTFIQKFPASQEMESANYGKAVALYQIERFDEAMAALRINLTKFNTSESVLDSQYLMALTMGTVANNNANNALKEPKPDPTIDKTYDNSELMLKDIVAKGSDVALANDSRFQIGELLFARAGFAKDEARRKDLFVRAMDVYRTVGAKDVVIAAQKSRIDKLKAMMPQALASRDPAQIQRIQRYIDKELEKLANIESRPDQTIAAKIKMGEIFFQQGKMDEARVLLTYTRGLTEDEEQKKTIAYYNTISLAQQNAEKHASVPALADRAEAAWAEFKTAHGYDPIAENVAIVLGAGFTDKDPPKAGKYLEEQIKNYPQSKLGVTSDNLLAVVLMNQGKFDEAFQKFTDVLARNPPREIAAAALFGKATVRQKQKRNAEAIPIYKEVRDKYDGTEQATNAAFYYAQLLQEGGDSKAALPELQAFLKKNPKHELTPTVLYYLGEAQAGVKQPTEALATYKRVATEFPEADVAPYTYFKRAGILMADQKTTEVVPLMQEFMKKYPNKDSLFQAYDFVAQIQSNEKKEPEAIETYEEFAKLKPQDPMSAQALLRVATMWKGLVDAMGRYLTLNEEQRGNWTKDIDSSVNAAERVIKLHPDSPQVALALGLILDDLKLRVTAKMATEQDVEQYFQKLAEEFKGKPATHSKIIFTLAGNLIEKDKAKAIQLMSGVYDPQLKYAPEDMDLYGTGLIDEKKLDEAAKVFIKLAADYPVADGVDPTKAPRDIQEAQSMSLFGLGKVLQEQGKVAEAKAKFDELEKLYGWSPKMLAANLGISLSLYQDKNYEEALKRLGGVIRASKAPADLRASAMLLLARIHEDMGNYDDAINNYIKINTFYQGVPKAAAEGLWRGSQLLEKQSAGQIPIATPPPKPTPVKKVPAAPVKK